MEEQVQDHKVKRMKLMRFWLIGTFLIVIAAITTYIMTWTQVGVMDALMVTRLLPLFSTLACPPPKSNKLSVPAPPTSVHGPPLAKFTWFML